MRRWMRGVLKLAPRALRRLQVTYARSELLAVALVAAVVAIWAAVAGGSFSLGALVACEAMFFAYYLTGSLCAAVKPLARGVLFDLPLRLLVGYGVINTVLLLLALISPLGTVVNFGILLALVGFAFFSTQRRRRKPRTAAGLWVVGISMAATTVWCQDSIQPTLDQGRFVLFKPWVDGFYHAVHIRMFAESHGVASLEDFRMAEVPARLYHYGVYLLPAVIKQTSVIHSYTAFAGVLVPVGVFFTGLAAYACFGSLWGAWPGVMAALAVLLLPDGAQQGMQNPFMSYHWLTHISPSATYGLALLAVAWLFVIRGCTRGSWPQLMAGWGVAGVLVAYKLHYVIASALLLLLVPALFFRRSLGPKKRALWAGGACLVYAAALLLGQRVPGVPLIRFDGSAVGEILHLVQTFSMPGPLTDTVTELMGRDVPTSRNLLYGIPYVLFASLGVFLPLLIALVIAVRKKVTLLHVLFPLLLLANFLAMFFGLALDFESSTPDELSHRPLMIVYFFCVAWVGGALGWLIFEQQQLARWARPAAIGLAAVLLAVPAQFGPGVQLMWVMQKISPVRLPKSLLSAAKYLRTNGRSEDIFQDSQFDRFYAVAALSERRSFVSHSLTRMPFRAELVATRSDAINRLMGLRQSKLVVGTARAYGLRWFVLHRGNRVLWPPELEDHPAFVAGHVRVYRF